MTVDQQAEVSDFGRLPDGSAAALVTLRSPGIELAVSTLGARVVRLRSPDREGRMGDISLGFADASGYLGEANPYIGATVGRVSNRIAHGRFSLAGREFRIVPNNGPNALHGGPEGFDRRNWAMELLPYGVRFLLTSNDGDQGFPGTLHATATYTLHGDRISLGYTAVADRTTVVSLTNHTYFNLEGEGTPSILDHELTLFADRFTPISEALIPTGELAPVAGTPFCFAQHRRIGERIDAADVQLGRARGYDHNFVVRGAAGTLRPAARVSSPRSGRVLEVATTEPGVQFYTGNFLDGSLTGRGGRPYSTRCALCLETQHFPDSPNQPQFPSITLRAGEEYRSQTTWTLSAG